MYVCTYQTTFNKLQLKGVKRNSLTRPYKYLSQCKTGLIRGETGKEMENKHTGTKIHEQTRHDIIWSLEKNRNI